ncbi:hypothetical protein LTR17_019030 [Elasticomyces elasticus]|nr:hypothetical protein LTR17_019030 [Elasticomyces elasticus]
MANVQQLQETLDAQAPLINALKKYVGITHRHVDLAGPLTFCSAFLNPKHSDLIIRCADDRWTVHKVIVCAQSPVLAKACEGRFKEAEEGLITLQEDDPRVVEAMLQFIYTLDFDDSCHDVDVVEMPAIVFNVNVHIAADKYDIPALRKLTASKFHAYALTKWDTAGFAEAAALVFDAGTAVEESLRDIVVSIATKNAKKLLGQDEVGTRFHAVASATPALAVALWQRQVEGQTEDDAEVKESKIQWYRCPIIGCGLGRTMSKDGVKLCGQCGRSTPGNMWMKV